MFLLHQLSYAYSYMLFIYIFIDSYKLYTFLLPSKIVKDAPKLEEKDKKPLGERVVPKAQPKVQTRE